MYLAYVNWVRIGQATEPHVMVIQDKDVEAALAKAEQLESVMDSNANLVKLTFRLDRPVRVGFANIELIGDYTDDITYDKLISLESGEHTVISEDDLFYWRKSLFYEEELALFTVDEFGVYALVGDNPYEEFPLKTKRGDG